jgi:peptidyl-prolyl cis-trans isomerase D
MLAVFRRLAGTWPARLLFLLLVAAFGLWGIGDVVRNFGRDTAVARVGGARIEVPQVQQAYQRALSRMQQMAGNRGEVPPPLRRVALDQAVDQLITEAAVRKQIQREGLAAPDAAVRDAVYALPAFKGTNGQFDRARFQSALQNNGLTEAGFIALMRDDLEQQQLLGSVAAGATAPDLLARRVYAFQHETRTAEVVALPFAAAVVPRAPTDEDLRRFYANNPDQFSAPETRRIRAVVLSPDTLARTITVSDADARSYYEQHKDQFVTPEKRSVQVVVAPSKQEAEAIAAQWKTGADWPAIQDAAKAAGASAVELTDAPATEFPDPALATAVFAAQPNEVTGPDEASLGWQVFRVSNATPGTNASFESVQDGVRAAVARQQAADQMDQKLGKLQDAVSAVSTLGDLPNDLGVAAVEGTLDAQGNTPSGQPAPLPGPPDLRKAIVAAAFQAHQGDPPNLVESPGGAQGGAWYAVEVEQVTPAAPKPYDQVADAVRSAWTAQQRRHEQETAAARLLTAVRSGGSLADAALVQNLHAQETPPIPRGAAPPPGVPMELARAVFDTPKGKAAMGETADAFFVAVTKDATSPDPASDPTGLAAVRDALTRQLAGDVEGAYVAAVRERANPRINQALLDTLVQQ